MSYCGIADTVVDLVIILAIFLEGAGADGDDARAAFGAPECAKTNGYRFFSVFGTGHGVTTDGYVVVAFVEE